MNESGQHIPVKVLIVDDYEENIHSLQTLLTQEGQNVLFFHATSGNEALKIAFREDLALVLLDVQMPEMDGYEVASILKHRKSTQNIPVIFVTALNQESKYVAEGYSKGAIDYLFKPLDPVITRAKFNSFVDIYIQQKKLENSYKDLELIVNERTADLQLKNDELLNAQKELKINNKKLVQLNEELDQFVYIASHDLKLPIANFEGLLEALEEEMKEVSLRSQPIFQMLEKSVLQMKDTINGLIDIIESQKEEELHVEEINCAQSLEEVKQSISQLIAESETKIVTEFEIDGHFRFNKTSFKSTLYNLITNAIKYRHPDRKPEISVGMRRQDSRFILSIKDNGSGMTEQERQKLFKIFSRVHSSSDAEGNGLGLFNLKNMLSKYNASIDVNSVKGEGSEFVVVFENLIKERQLV